MNSSLASCLLQAIHDDVSLAIVDDANGLLDDVDI